MGARSGEIKLGDIVRYRKGRTALMRCDEFYDFGGKVGKRFFGLQCCGDWHGAYESDCVLASEEDLKTWQVYKIERYSSFIDWKNQYSEKKEA